MGEYHLRKKEKEISDKNEINEILKNGKYAIIGFSANNDPYLVTLSYGYDMQNERLYFHCALKGQKIDYLTKNPKVCATVIEDKGYVKDFCEHKYSSLIIRGSIRVVDELDEKKHGLDVLLNHLEENPDPIKTRNIKDDKSYNSVCILCIDISDITGKRN